MKSAERYRIVLVTAGNQKTALKISKVLVSSGAAACVSIVPRIRSIYRWRGKVHDDTELLLVIKTVRKRLPLVEKLVIENHPYEVPEIVSLAMDQGFEKYLSWLLVETKER